MANNIWLQHQWHVSFLGRVETQLKRHSLHHYLLKWRSKTMRQADQVVQAALPVVPALLVIRTAIALRHLDQNRLRDWTRDLVSHVLMESFQRAFKKMGEDSVRRAYERRLRMM
ncbi:hypothetical protein Bca52824_061760 [Brassica carinata]|uniref:Uncharacterized protein n=1 Tax=Brassica carinata TaxID=52824 RepID=A0A8X7QEK8_BRACI|nr:hypothetical protein Bca52824_061760 [Brassica carinata]